MVDTLKIVDMLISHEEITICDILHFIIFSTSH